MVLALALGGTGLVLPLPSMAQTRTLPTQTITVSGTIESIDDSRHTVNIRKADGNIETINVPVNVKQFDQFKVGDKVSATYNNTVTAKLKPPGEPPVDTIDEAYSKEQTSGTKVMVRRMTASIVALDKGASSATFEAPNGWKYSRRVVDPAVFDKVKVGDKVDIIWNTDLTVSVK